MFTADILVSTQTMATELVTSLHLNQETNSTIHKHQQKLDYTCGRNVLHAQHQ
jgi:hypothetical protein